MAGRKRRRRVAPKRRRKQWGAGVNLVGAIQKLNPPEMHWPGYQYMGPFTKLKKRLAR